jgi:hypothetical protein
MSAGAGEEGGEGAVIFFPETQRDFGIVFQGEKPSHAFEFANLGVSDLVIRQIDADCACVGKIASASEVAPGETGQIEVQQDTTGKDGVNRHTVRVHSNDPDNPVVTLRVEAVVVRPLRLHTDSVEFGQVPEGATAERPLNFSVGQKIRFDGAFLVGRATEYLSLRQVPVPPRREGENEYSYIVGLEPEVPPGKRFESIRIRTGTETEWRDTYIPVTFEVVSAEGPRQKRLDLAVSADGRAEGLVPLLGGETGIYFGAPEVDIPGAEAEAELGLEDGAPVLRLTAKLKDLRRGASGVVRVPSSHPMVPVVEVPVRISPPAAGS